MGGRIYGYARVSATDQNLDRQREALAGVDMLVEEKVSGKSRDGREKLRTLIEFADEGDVVRVKSIDRLARNTRDLLAIVDELAAKGVGVEFVDTPQLNVTTKEGRAMLTIFAAFAQLERESIRERQMEGIALAKAAGRYAKGPKLTAEQIAEARQKVDSGVPKAAVARSLSVSRQTLHTALKGEGRYAEASPFQWYGNKREAAGLVWRLLGDPTIYLEPFFGAGGVLLNRPTAASSWQLEVVNDIDGALVNAWRALRADPEGLADLLMDPITEIDKHARGAAVIAWRESEGREHLGGDPYFYDLEMAAFWLYFACLMIGGDEMHGPWVSDGERLVKSETGHGICRSKPSTNTSGYLRSRIKGREALTLYFMVLSERLTNVVVLNGGWERCVTSSMLNGNRRFSADMSGCAVFLDPPYADMAERTLTWPNARTGYTVATPSLSLTMFASGVSRTLTVRTPA